MQTKTVFLLIALLLGSYSVVLAQTEVTGRVTDARDGAALSNVSVTAKGSRTGTTTDNDGRYRLSVPSDAVLVFSSIGFSSKEVRVTGSTLNVTLDVAQRDLQEVVVTGYNTQSRRQASASITKITGEEVRF